MGVAEADAEVWLVEGWFVKSPFGIRPSSQYVVQAPLPCNINFQSSIAAQIKEEVF